MKKLIEQKSLDIKIIKWEVVEWKASYANGSKGSPGNYKNKGYLKNKTKEKSAWHYGTHLIIALGR